MAFTPSSRNPPFLCVASTHGTVHIFRLAEPSSHGAKAVKAVAKTVLSAMIHKSPPTCSGEKWAKIELQCKKEAVAVCAVKQESRTAAAAAAAAGEEEEQELRVLVATSEGILYQYGVEDLGKSRAACLEGQWVFS